MTKIDTYRFGRLGTFDLIDLLVQLHLINAGPKSATWQVHPHRRRRELDHFAEKLARESRLSCFVVEDALCNFSKESDSCCGDPDAADCERGQ